MHPLLLLRRIATTVGATVAGVYHVATHTAERMAELKPGDEAPDFTLTGSDGRTYRLRDLRGRRVVLAWFPKAFTGG